MFNSPKVVGSLVATFLMLSLAGTQPASTDCEALRQFYSYFHAGQYSLPPCGINNCYSDSVTPGGCFTPKAMRENDCYQFIHHYNMTERVCSDATGDLVCYQYYHPHVGVPTSDPVPCSE